MWECFKKNYKRILFLVIYILLFFLTFSILVLGFFFYEYWDIKEFDHLWEYLDHSTISNTATILLGALTMITGYKIWFTQHKKEIDDENIKEFCDAIIEWYQIKTQQIRFREKSWKSREIKNSEGNIIQKKGNRHDYYNTRIDDLDLQRTKVQGLIETRYSMLQKHKTNRNCIYKIYTEFNKFGSLEKKFTEIKIKQKKDFNKINCEKKSSYEEHVLKNIKSLNF